jgi:hypothetical protein
MLRTSLPCWIADGDTALLIDEDVRPALAVADNATASFA